MADRLTLKEKTDVISKYLEGMPINEIAKRKNRSPSTIDLVVKDFRKGMAPIENPDAGLLADDMIDIAKVKREQNLTYEDFYSAVVLGLSIKNKDVDTIAKIATYTESLPPEKIPGFLKSLEQIYKTAEDENISVEEIAEKVNSTQRQYNTMSEKHSNLLSDVKNLGIEKENLKDEVLKNKKELEFANKMKDRLKYLDENKILELLGGLSKNSAEKIMETTNLLDSAGISLDRFKSLTETLLYLVENGFTDATLKKLKESLAKENIDADEFFQKIKQYAQNRETLQEDIKNLKKEKETKQKGINNKNKKLSDIQDKINKSNIELNNTDKNIKGQEKIYNDLSDKNKKLILKNQDLQKEIETNTNTAQKLKEQIGAINIVKYGINSYKELFEKHSALNKEFKENIEKYMQDYKSWEDKIKNIAEKCGQEDKKLEDKIKDLAEKYNQEEKNWEEKLNQKKDEYLFAESFMKLVRNVPLDKVQIENILKKLQVKDPQFGDYEELRKNFVMLLFKNVKDRVTLSRSEFETNKYLIGFIENTAYQKLLDSKREYEQLKDDLKNAIYTYPKNEDFAKNYPLVNNIIKGYMDLYWSNYYNNIKNKQDAGSMAAATAGSFISAFRPSNAPVPTLPQHFSLLYSCPQCKMAAMIELNLAGLKEVIVKGDYEAVCETKHKFKVPSCTIMKDIMEIYYIPHNTASKSP